eukprot:gene16111-11529_t
MHLLGNIPRPAFSEQQRQEFFRIVRSKTPMEYDQRMKVLKNTHEQVYPYLGSIDPSLWVDFAQPHVKKGNSRIQHGRVPEENTTIEEGFVYRPINESSRPTGYHTSVLLYVGASVHCMHTLVRLYSGDPKVFHTSTSGPLHSSRN